MGTKREFGPQRILVTGGAGFIGSHLCARLLAEGQEVLCVDNFYTGSRENLQPILNHPRFEFLRHDVTHPLYVEVDQIYNLALSPTTATSYGLSWQVVPEPDLTCVALIAACGAWAVRRRTRAG